MIRRLIILLFIVGDLPVNSLGVKKMAKSNLSQKILKAIVFTDMADFTKISAQDEQKALDLIKD